MEVTPPELRDRDGRLRFEPVIAAHHAELVHDWMNRPHVAPWWQLAVSLPEIRGYLEGLTHLEPWLVSVDLGVATWQTGLSGRGLCQNSKIDAGQVPFGYVETYRVADDPLAEYYDTQPGDLGWHVLVGPESFLGTGVPRLLGRSVVASLLGHDFPYASQFAPRVVCEPDIRNTRMHAFCRALGHEAVAEIDLPDKRALLMVCTRESFDALWRGGGGNREVGG